MIWSNASFDDGPKSLDISVGDTELVSMLGIKSTRTNFETEPGF